MKQFIEWRNNWSLGNDIIDQHHHQLAIIFNNIVEIYLNNDMVIDSEQQSWLLHELLNIFSERVREHFNEEDELMRNVNYPERTDHVREHLMLQAELRHYLKHIEEQVENINLGSLNSLKGWFISHITSSDKKLANYLKTYRQEEIAIHSKIMAG